MLTFHSRIFFPTISKLNHYCHIFITSEKTYIESKLWFLFFEIRVYWKRKNTCFFFICFNQQKFSALLLNVSPFQRVASRFCPPIWNLDSQRVKKLHRSLYIGYVRCEKKVFHMDLCVSRMKLMYYGKGFFSAWRCAIK